MNNKIQQRVVSPVNSIAYSFLLTKNSLLKFYLTKKRVHPCSTEMFFKETSI